MLTLFFLSYFVIPLDVFGSGNCVCKGKDIMSAKLINLLQRHIMCRQFKVLTLYCLV